MVLPQRRLSLHKRPIDRRRVFVLDAERRDFYSTPLGRPMKMRLMVVLAVVFSACGVAWGQIPIGPQNRIVGGKLYNPMKSVLWMDITTNILGDVPPRVNTYAPPAPECSSIKVVGVGKTSIGCDVFKELLDDGGTYGVYRVIGEEYVKSILIYNHPAHDEITTGTAIYEGRYKMRGRTSTTKWFLCMRVANWRTNNVVLEAYDCGLPDTAENRKKAGIAVPTPEQVAEKRRVAQQPAVEAAAAKKQAADAATLKFYQELAEKGDASGQYRMGIRYLKGDGVPKDLDKARDYLSTATAQGNQDAAAELARLSAPELPVQTNSPPKKGEDH